MEGTINVKRKDLHDLKSTLTAVIGYIQLAQKKIESCDESSKAAVKELLDKSMEVANTLDLKIRELELVKEPLMDL